MLNTGVEKDCNVRTNNKQSNRKINMENNLKKKVNKQQTSILWL